VANYSYIPLNSDSEIEDEIGGECSTYGTDEKCIQDFAPRTWREDTALKT